MIGNFLFAAIVGAILGLLGAPAWAAAAVGIVCVLLLAISKSLVVIATLYLKAVEEQDA